MLRSGAPWQQTLEVAREIGADLIVMGTHGRSGLAHAFLGSVAEKVVRMSPIPVLTLRAEDA
jgi:universal stress protein A